jgi:hypothetical protein
MIDGCPSVEGNEDGDAVMDIDDKCPGTPVGDMIDSDGCSLGQLDGDDDGVSDADDQCPNTPITEVADASGCAASEKDADDDGIIDDLDQCPSVAGIAPDGCPTNQKPTCDIYYSIEANGIVAQGDVVIDSISGTAGIIKVPPGSYYVVAKCEDPDGDEVDVTITTPLGTHSDKKTIVIVGALIEVTEDMSETIPVHLTWNDGTSAHSATVVIDIGDNIPMPPSSNPIPGFTLGLTFVALLGAGLILNRKSEQ